jgi:hypothetical protein
MIQLTFQPALDPFHTVFRLLRLRPLISRRGPLHRDFVRILDFYLVFPFRIEDIRLLPKHRRYKTLLTRLTYSKPYGDQPDDQPLFLRMEMIQNAALETLVNETFFDPAAWNVSEVRATDVSVPPPISARIEGLNSLQPELLKFLETLATEYTLLGPAGLKARTGLIEFRYDPV